MKQTNTRSFLSALDLILVAVASLFLALCFCAPKAHAQVSPALLAPATAPTETLTGPASTVVGIAQAVDPGFFTQAHVTTITSIIVIIATVARLILKYFPGLRSAQPGSGAATVANVLNHLGGVITCLLFVCLLGLTAGCSTAQVARFRADANTAATDVLLAAPKALAYTATASADVLIVVKDLTPLATEVQAATAAPVAVTMPAGVPVPTSGK